MTLKQQQYQYENGNPEYDQRLNYKRSPTYNRRMTPNNYNYRQTNNNNYPMRTPQPQYNQNKAQIQVHYDNYDYNMRGSRTPFIDYRTGQNVYCKRGFTPG